MRRRLRPQWQRFRIAARIHRYEASPVHVRFSERSKQENRRISDFGRESQSEALKLYEDQLTSSI